jgi:hypothetical protein
MTKFGKTLVRSLMIVLGLIVVSGAILIYLTWDFLRADPLDRYESVASVSDHHGQRHAEIFRHYHADASTTVTGLWIWSGRGPASTPDHTPRGKLEFVWSGSPTHLHLAWRQESDRLSVEIAGPVDIRSENGDFNKCYFGYDKNDLLPANLVCYQSKDIDFRTTHDR